MVTGRRAFPGQTISDVIARVLEREPDWRLLPATLSPRIQWLLHRCLAKDPKHRLHDIADARIEIDEALINPSDSAGQTAPPVGARPNKGTHRVGSRRDLPDRTRGHPVDQPLWFCQSCASGGPHLQFVDRSS